MTHNFFTRRKLFFVKKSQKGFSLLEAIVSIAVFTIIMVATAETFASMIQTKVEADRMRESHQKAQVAIESITKSIRSGVVVIPASGYASQDTIRIYDYSQSLCIEYSFLVTALQKKTASIDFEDREECKGSPSFSSFQTMVDNTVKGKFDISWNDDKYVTIRLLLISPNKESFTNQTRVQTTVAMRNLK
ncbi:MAG: type II secretion system protein [Candidatus Moranbacteria bacterium]|nr:type II secretion system protein [Candidatus Moranbacteria bacterium]